MNATATARPQILLRPYQKKLVHDIRAEFSAGNRRVLAELSTGGGKTYTFCYIADRIQAGGKRAYILVHRDNLLGQTMDSLKSIGVKFRVIAPGYTQLDYSLQVCSVFTLAKRLKDTPEPDLLIIDEAHHANAGSWRKILEYWPRARVLGVTATPVRSDGTGLGEGAGGFFHSMVNGPTMRSLIDMGNLSEYEYYLPPVGADLSGVGVKKSDFDRAEIDAAMNKPKITGCAVEHYLNICPNAPAIAFCVSIAHANDVAAKFRAAGVSAQALTSEMSRDQIRSAIKALGEGRIKILTSCDIISEGTDIPIVTTAILLRPTHSLGLYLQQVGRVLRPAPGKKYAIILDHVNNLGRHGLPDQIREWSLDAKKKRAKKGLVFEEEKSPSMRQCGECFFVHTPQPTCPKCGFVYGNNERVLEQIDGALKKISKDELERIRKAKASERGRITNYEDFVALGKERGYKNPHGWAHNMMRVRSKQGRA